jgi:adenylate cyclase
MAVEASRQQLLKPVASRPPVTREREPGKRIVDRITRRAIVALALANGAGALVTFVLGAWVIPPPAGIKVSDNMAANVIAFAAALVVGLVVGTMLSIRLSREAREWLAEDRVPTPRERDATLRFPLRQTALSAGLWVLVAVEFFAVNLGTSTVLAFDAGLEVLLGGLVTCSLTYLLIERLYRDAIARALETSAPDYPTGPGIGCRLILTWAASSAVPLVAVGLIGLAALSDYPVSPERIGLAVAVLAAVGALVGFATMVIAARSLSEPLRGLRTALGRIEAGELEVTVPVDDPGEVGVLQGGFNRMAHGLRERERLRDLFGRHVGEDVARHALEHGVALGGGEVCDAAVIFADLQGSTRLAATRPPGEVVAVLNAYFGIVVDVVSAHGGLINKFQGDAALAIFGAPQPLEDPAGQALAAARKLSRRLQAELPQLLAGIGVSSGQVVAGHIGAEERLEYTVIGDPVNEAARLSDIAKSTNERLLASATVVAAAQPAEAAHWRLGNTVTLRGRPARTRLATPFGPPPPRGIQRVLRIINRR